MDRVEWDVVRINMCKELSKRSTCWKKKTAAIIVSNENRIISEGYNGTTSGSPHCCTIGPRDRLEHRKWSIENEIHAEINAIIWTLHKDKLKGATMYTLLSPCFRCSEMIRIVDIKRVVYAIEYRENGIDFLRRCGVRVDKI